MNPAEHPEPKLVLLPTLLEKERLYRICYFGGWEGNSIRCIDTGLMRGKAGIYPNMKHKLQEYRFPAERAIFVFDGGAF